MRLVIADTSPINYLILIRHIDLLPRLFEKVVLPTAVQDELMDMDAPQEVRGWIAHSPAWLEILEAPVMDMGSVALDDGETAVIALAESLQADLLLMDDRKGVKAARGKGLRVTGTLGLLEMAAQEGLIDFAQAAERLRRTSFRVPEALLDSLLEKHNENAARPRSTDDSGIDC